MSFSIYLASPYSSDDPMVRAERYEAACKKAAELMQMGFSVFSPIAHSHPISAHLPPERVVDHEFWMGQDLPILDSAERLYVLMLPGWVTSRGIAREVEEARRLGIPVVYENP